MFKECKDNEESFVVSSQGFSVVQSFVSLAAKDEKRRVQADKGAKEMPQDSATPKAGGRAIARSG
jgi:hypothetical protein